MGKPEGNIEDYLIKQAEKHDFLCYKFVSPGKRGVPDRIVIGRGHTVFVELKSPTGVLSKQQVFVIGEMRKRGADVRVIANRSDVLAFFEEADEW